MQTPCPSCGHCPTCGYRPYIGPWYPTQQQPFIWTTTTTWTQTSTENPDDA